MVARRLWFSLSLLAVVVGLGAAPALGAVAVVSINSQGGLGLDASWAPSISADGNLVVFMSLAPNLVADDTNGKRDIFLHNRVTRQTRRISVASDGTQANGDCWEPVISANGQIVAFSSDASNLVADDTNGVRDVFVHDLVSGQTTRVSVASGGGEANGPSRDPAINADGRFVAFTSTASNLAAGDTNGVSDVFLHDRSTVSTQLVSVGLGGAPGNGASRNPAVNGDGTVVAFDSAASNLVDGDTNQRDDVFVRVGGATGRVSVAATGAQGWGHSQDPSISADGNLIAFKSNAPNLIPGDMNGAWDVFVVNRVAPVVALVSVSSSGLQSDLDSLDPNISRNGRFVAFASRATNLSDTDRNSVFDIFVRDLQLGTTRNVSRPSTTVESNGHSWWPAVAESGEVVAFWSEASNLVPNDGNTKPDVFVGVPAGTGGTGGGDPGTWDCYLLQITGGDMPTIYSLWVPVTINRTDGVAGIQFTFSWDPKVLQCVEIVNDQTGGISSVTSNFTMETNVNNTEGWATVAMADDTPLGAGTNGVVCFINFVSVGTAGQSAGLGFESVLIFDGEGMPLPLCTVSGGDCSGGATPWDVTLQTCPHPADYNQDQDITSDDAIIALQAGAGLPKPAGWPDGWAWPPDPVCHDLNDDGVIDTGDAVIILGLVAANEEIVFPFTELQGASAGAAMLTTAGVGRTVSLPAATIAPGGRAVVPISVDDATGIAGAEFTVTFDPALVQVSSVRKGALASGLALSSNTDTPGQVGIALAGTTAISGGSGALVEIVFQALAAEGSTPLAFTRCNLRDDQPMDPTDIASVPVNGGLTIAYGTGFSDVPDSYWAADAIVACVEAGIVTGFGDGVYAPGLAVTRDQLAVYLARALAGGDDLVPAAGAAHFADVPPANWAFKYVEYAYARGVVAGYDDGLYHPLDVVTRGQMAVFMARAMVADGAAPVTPATVQTFADVSATNAWSWCYDYVEYVAAAEVASGYSEGGQQLYHPEYAVTRDQLAVYVARAFGLL